MRKVINSGVVCEGKLSVTEKDIENGNEKLVNFIENLENGNALIVSREDDELTGVFKKGDLFLIKRIDGDTGEKEVLSKVKTAKEAAKEFSKLFNDVDKYDRDYYVDKSRLLENINL